MKYLRALLFFVATVLLYLGLPLLGWGLGDLPGFFALAPRTGFASAVLAFGIAVGVQAIEHPEGIRGGGEEEGKRIGRQHVVRLALIALLYAVLVILPFADRRGIGVFTAALGVRWLGVALFALGMAFVFLSGLALGRNYSQEVTIQRGHQLITGGVFRVIRHPRYLGVLLGALGLALAFRSWIGLALFLPLAAVLLLRIRDEEALLHREFGEAWEGYCRRSWRLVPGVW